jgi:hypothetical protein
VGHGEEDVNRQLPREQTPYLDLYFTARHGAQNTTGLVCHSTNKPYLRTCERGGTKQHCLGLSQRTHESYCGTT